MKKIIVTGVSGFIGNHCIPFLLERRYEIHAISRTQKEDDNKNVNWYYIDLFDTAKVEEVFKQVKATYFLHLAWKVESGLKLNSNENEKWFHLSKKLTDFFYLYGGERLLVTGSCFEYDHSDGIISEEKTDLKPNNEYGKNKNKLYQHLKKTSEERGISYAWARIFFTFGPGQKPQSLVPYVISSIINNNIIETTDGNQKYDYVYVEDVALALVQVLESDYIGAVNISSGKTLKLKELISSIAKKFDKEDFIKFGVRERPKGSPDMVLGLNDVLVKETNWKANYTLDQAIEKTIKYYSK
ncbi:NAD-dependent epimerase/dehydratase family protein [Aureibaculum conchae]|uniref:NAD-dependent epimerase/dehydratase family protein n=1 Tax=Aureibaculum sp. 2308TA14-22 TaxID=3108392 RepID=UPI0033923CFB